MNEETKKVLLRLHKKTAKLHDDHANSIVPCMEKGYHTSADYHRASVAVLAQILTVINEELYPVTVTKRCATVTKHKQRELKGWKDKEI